MAELQTIDEMRAAYDGEWVLIVDCEYDEGGRLVRGRVAAHGPRKSDAHREMVHYSSGAIRYFGEVPADIIYIL